VLRSQRNLDTVQTHVFYETPENMSVLRSDNEQDPKTVPCGKIANAKSRTAAAYTVYTEVTGAEGRADCGSLNANVLRILYAH